MLCLLRTLSYPPRDHATAEHPDAMSRAESSVRRRARRTRPRGERRRQRPACRVRVVRVHRLACAAAARVVANDVRSWRKAKPSCRRACCTRASRHVRMPSNPSRNLGAQISRAHSRSIRAGSAAPSVTDRQLLESTRRVREPAFPANGSTRRRTRIVEVVAESGGMPLLEARARWSDRPLYSVCLQGRGSA